MVRSLVVVATDALFTESATDSVGAERLEEPETTLRSVSATDAVLEVCDDSDVRLLWDGEEERDGALEVCDDSDVRLLWDGEEERDAALEVCDDSDVRLLWDGEEERD
eukprot:Opistho-1_new@90930